MKLDLLVGDNIKISLDYSPENQLGLLFVRLVQEISNLAQGPAAAQVLEEAIEDVKAKKLNSQTLVLSSSSQVPPNANNYQSANARQLPQNYQNVLNESYSNTARPQTQNSLRDQQTLPQPPLFEQSLPQPQQRQFSQQQNANIPQQPLLRRRGQSDVMQYSQVGTNPNVGIRTDRNYSNGIVSQGNMSNGQQPMQGVLQHQPPLPPPRHPQMPYLSSQQVVQQYQRQLQQHLGQPDVQNVAKPQPVDEMTQLILDVCSQDADKRQKGADTLSENLSDGNESDSFRRQFVNKFVEHVIALDGVHAEECIQLLKKTGELLGQEIMGRNSQVVRQLNHFLRVSFEKEIGGLGSDTLKHIALVRATGVRYHMLDFGEIVNDVITEYLQVDQSQPEQHYGRFCAGLYQIVKLIMQGMDKKFVENKFNLNSTETYGKQILDILEGDLSALEKQAEENSEREGFDSVVNNIREKLKED